ncbi:MAG: efflux RND transporter periplasmic adaptor subunit [Elainellaceae cyanobacterium]
MTHNIPAQSDSNGSPGHGALERTVVDPFDESPRRSSNQGWWSGKAGIVMGLGIGVLIGAVGAVGVGQRSASPDTETGAVENIAETSSEPAAAQAVTVSEAALTPVSRVLEATGTIEAYDLLPILPRVSGLQVQQVLVDEGDRVSAGQVLAVLDQSVLRAEIAEAQADLEAAQARVQQQEAAVAQAQARVVEAQAQVARYERLASDGAISDEELETRDTAAVTAQEDVRLAQANLSSASADVRSQQAQVQQLQAQLEQTEVRAPADGLVAERNARVGNVTANSTQLFSIIRDRLLELQVPVPETQLPQVSPGAPVTITSDADPRIQIQGQVREIAPLIDPETREATVAIDLPPSDLLRPGMFLRATITTATASGVTVPAQAVVPQSDGQATVYRIQGDRVEAVTVALGELMDSADPAQARIEIEQGLAPGDRVVVEGAGYVSDGDAVDIVSDIVSN